MMLPIGTDSLQWLVEWGETRYEKPLSPLRLPGPVLALHPFTTPDGDEYTWHHLAKANGGDLEATLKRRVSPQALYDRRPNRLRRLNLPDEGHAPLAVRRAITDAIGRGLEQHVTFGLYGGWGEPEEIKTSVGPLEVTGLEYWFGRTEGAQLFANWAKAADGAASRWGDLMSFAWPDDRSWFLHLDPDVFHTDLYGPPDVLDRLMASGLETYRAQR